MWFHEWGFDYLPDAGTVESATCGICNANMTVERNKPRRFDHFICPHKDEKWHKQVFAL